MELLLDLLVVVLIFAVSYGTSKKKKAKEQARKQPSAEQKKNRGTVYTHPYNESPKEKGISLEEFRKKYADEIDTAKEAVKKTAAMMLDDEIPQGDWDEPDIKSAGSTIDEGRPTEGRTVFSPKAEGRATEGRPTEGRPTEGRPTEGRRGLEGLATEGRQTEGDITKPISKPQTAAKVHKPKVTAVKPIADSVVTRLESGAMIGKKQVINHNLESGVDVAAFLAAKKLTPVQQGFVWAEIFGEPKAKRQRGYRL